MATRETNVLSDLELRRWIREKRPLAKTDGGGLTFTLSASGTASWVLRFRIGGKPEELTLGRYPDLTLSAARKLAAEKRVEVQKGRNPANEKRKDKSRKNWTVRQLIGDYREKVLVNLATSTQRSYGRNLKRVENVLGAMQVREAEAADIVGLIERTDLGWVEANTLLIVAKAIFRHAAGKKVINTNPAIGVELVSVIGPRPPIRQRLMLTANELHVLLNADMNRENLLSVCILLATGVRSEELYKGLRTHVSLDEARWHIPGSKTGAAMDIPLAPIVVDWFRELLSLNTRSRYILPTRAASRAARHGGDAHLSKDAIREAIDYWIDNHKPSIRRFTPHDLRSTMKSHLRKLKISRDVSEMCLNHKLPGVEGIYDQYTYYGERRYALERWATFIEGCRQSNEYVAANPMEADFNDCDLALMETLSPIG
ncbi:tyrosine-type recombinase/integrase [Burkholderia multivorans]|uniref:tyrosine-type recombinase/integrase n=1 Tax=Burkholderia multivorans TaxID=87883 RepID=UPI0019D20814|nr:site-specific integrase [Burkholderia multivorans]MBN6736830.1 site-specific integrase [Burkholderia multivorans]MBN7129407.1 site-specific integrase [Burkholderia multivorans]QSL25713.1 site-specific integrase [Burkholderia multivorans]